MTNDSTRPISYQAALNDLMQEPYGVEDREDIDRATAVLSRIVFRRTDSATVNYAATLEAAKPDSDEVINPHPYDGLSCAEASVKYLQTLPHKSDQRIKKIVEALQAAGYEFEAENPAASTGTALKRRTINYGDVVLTGHGRWGLRDWYSQRELTAFRHKERTLAGMEAAKARGVKIGKAWKINESQAIEFKRLVESNAKVSHICDVFRISVTAVRNYKEKLADWNPGDPFPPTNKETKSDDPAPDKEHDNASEQRMSLVK